MQFETRFFIFVLLFLFQNKCKGTVPDRRYNCADSDKVKIKNLKQKLKHIQIDCGEVCNTEMSASEHGLYYDVIQKNVDCLALYESPLLDKTGIREDFPEGARYRPPMWCHLPDILQEALSYNYRLKELPTYIDESSWSSSPLVWQEAMIDAYRKGFKNGERIGSYGKKCDEMIWRFLNQHMKDEVTGGHVLVIGSQSPWIEAILLEAGAANITTLEYTTIDSQHPQIKAVTPDDFRVKFMEGHFDNEKDKFDAVVTYSSIEHSGLGRYGDDINPWADLIAMARAWCVTKKGGKMLIGVPTGPDTIFFNGARIYGPLLYPHLFANWHVLYTDAEIGDDYDDDSFPTNYQPIHILQKPADTP